jgi:hypothetical protein
MINAVMKLTKWVAAPVWIVFNCFV